MAPWGSKCRAPLFQGFLEGLYKGYRFLVLGLHVLFFEGFLKGCPLKVL